MCKLILLSPLRPPNLFNGVALAFYYLEMNMLTQIKIILGLCLALSLVACNTLGGGTQPDGAAPSIIGSLVQSQIKAKGPKMFCSQPTYQKCLGQTEAQCTAEQSTFSGACVTTAQNLSGGAGVSSAAFATHYASCMSVKHGLLHPERALEIKSCVAGANFDYMALLRSVIY